MYIYNRKNWPQFIWDETSIAYLLSSLRHQQGKLLGKMQSIGFQLQTESILENLTQEVVKSSEIEGEILNLELVRSSVARHLGIEQAAVYKIDKNIEGIVEITLDATQNYNTPITEERLFKWHSLLFPNKNNSFHNLRIGSFRKNAVEVISGRPGRETIHFEGPPPEIVSMEMERFLHWINTDNSYDNVLKSAIAHLWFVTIHPFDDGNGRIGRAISDLLLARSENCPQRFYSLSAQIQKERKNYYSILENTQKGLLTITPWMEWFLGCLYRSINNALDSFETIWKIGKFWEDIKEVSINSRQKKVINLIFQKFDGHLTSSKWAKITKCSQDTAYRDILELIDLGILEKSSKKGRSTSYFINPKYLL